jgi:predicted dehydrogenase
MIGGGFMGRTHSNAYNQVSHFFPELAYRPVLQAVCTRSPDKVRALPRSGATRPPKPTGGPSSAATTSTPWTSARPTTPTPKSPLRRAEAGKMILCEKPAVADPGRKGKRMVEAVERAGVPNTVWYNYRRLPAVTLAKQLVDAGKLGRIYHYRANFLQGLDHQRRPAAGRHGPLAHGRGRGRLRA